MKKLIFFCLLTAGTVMAGTASGDGFALLRQALQLFLDAEELSFEYTIVSKCFTADKKPVVKTYKGNYLRKGSSFLMNYDDITTVNTEGYLINISRSEKTLLIQRSKKEVDTDFLFQEIDSARYAVSGTVTAAGNSQKVVFVPQPGYQLDHIKNTELLLDSKGWVEQLTVNYDTRRQVDFDEKCSALEIRYRSYAFAVPATRLLTLAHYVQIRGEQVTPSDNFKGYQVISSLSYESQ